MQKGVPMSDSEFIKKAMQIICGGDAPLVTIPQLEEIISTYLLQLEDN